ncbi:MAG: ATPase, partial [Bacteroidota bacterium]
MATPTRPADLFDREVLWTRLGEAHAAPGPGLVLMMGRRRAGKSFLLTRFAEAVGGAYYQATRRTEREQLLALSRVLAERFDDAALRRAALPDWEALLGYVAERAEGAPFLLVLDEFP